MQLVENANSRARAKIKILNEFNGLNAIEDIFTRNNAKAIVRNAMEGIFVAFNEMLLEDLEEMQNKGNYDDGLVKAIEKGIQLIDFVISVCKECNNA